MDAHAQVHVQKRICTGVGIAECGPRDGPSFGTCNDSSAALPMSSQVWSGEVLGCALQFVFGGSTVSLDFLPDGPLSATQWIRRHGSRARAVVCCRTGAGRAQNLSPPEKIKANGCTAAAPPRRHAR